ncbi:MAG TPA: alpha/beta fold hydrolase [Acidimicrobiia bacterium]|nr:alpha/beta fold hydrolase [Acidimicrobiia bacterium]
MELHELDRQRRTVSTRRGDVSILDVGRGPAALLVHGVGTNALLWRNLLPAVAAERRCIALDLPRHGRTPAPADGDVSLGGLADVVAACCEALDLGAVDLVANDTGGAVAQIFAARNPQRIRTMTLTNCETHDNVPPPAFQATVDLARAGQLAPGAPALLADLAVARETIFASGYEHPEALNLDVVRAFLEPVLGTPEAARGFEQLLAGLAPDDLLAVEPALARLTVPTLVVWGTADPFFEVRWAYWLRDTIPGVTEVVELEGAKLFFPDERASELAGLVLGHWAAAADRTVAPSR